MNKAVVRELLDYLKMIVFVLVLVFVVNNFIVVNALIPSESMENTIMTKDRIFGNRLAYTFGDPKCGDIIIFKYPDNENELYIKRVIGTPGDTVEIVDGEVYINGSDTPLVEPYLPEPMICDDGFFEVPDDSYFVMGDNRNRSHDSRRWENTYVRDDQILGKAMFRYFPFNKMGTIK